MQQAKSNIYQRVCAGCFIALLIFWAYLYLTHHRTSATPNYWYSFLFGLVPFFGGFIGVLKARQWGGLKSVLGRAVFFTSLGLFLWGCGENVWSYYNFFKGVPAPYPSLADVFFAPSVFCWIIGTAYFSVATGALLSLRKTRWAKFVVVLLPLVLLLVSYYIQITIARSGVLLTPGESIRKAIFDIGYPFGDFLSLTFIALICTLAYRYFGGFYRKSIVVLLAGLAVIYISDSVFSYTTTKGTYYNADWGDLLYALGTSLMTFGLLGFATKPLNAIGDSVKGAVLNLHPIYNLIATRIIEQQETIIGPAAIDRAKAVPGIRVDWKQQHTVDIQGDPRQAIDELIERYKELFGQAAVEACKGAANQLLPQVPKGQFPKSLQ